MVNVKRKGKSNQTVKRKIEINQNWTTEFNLTINLIIGEVVNEKYKIEVRKLISWGHGTNQRYSLNVVFGWNLHKYWYKRTK